VVGFHAFPGWLRGGFIGVDIFFVISGFLISTIILENLDRGTFIIPTSHTSGKRCYQPVDQEGGIYDALELAGFSNSGGLNIRERASAGDRSAYERWEARDAGRGRANLSFPSREMCRSSSFREHKT
jgi:hypothetical protein